MKKIRIAVIYGGVSGEHEVSLLSARSIIGALAPEKYEVTPIRIGKNGTWAIDGALLPRTARRSLSAGPRTLAPGTTGASLTRRDGTRAETFDVVFPIVHGTGGEDGALQGLFELAGAAYVGSGVLGSAIGMDKILQKKVFEHEGFPVAPYEHFTAAEWKRSKDAIVSRIASRLRYPCFVKPSNMGSSVGISKAHHRKELVRGIVDALRYDRRVLVEAGVPEAREIECAVLGNDEPRASVLGEIIPSGEFYDYAAKYLDGRSRVVIPADLPKRAEERIRTLALRAFAALDCAGLARVDFFVRRDSGDVYLNEINTLPGFTDISMYPKLWEATDIHYSALLDEIVRLAIERHRDTRMLTRSFSPPTSAKKTKS